jgi:hypothetical protein
VRAARIPLLALLPLVLAGCGGDGGADSSTPAPEPTASTSDAAFWNPCDGLVLGPVQRALGAGLRADRGTDDVPRCALLPRQEGGAVLDVNYTAFAGTLDEAWEAMGAPDDGSVTEPEIPEADDARLVVDAGSEVLGVTGFVQRGGFVVLVNAADTTPYDRQRVVDAVRVVMTQVAGDAPQ